MSVQNESKQSEKLYNQSTSDNYSYESEQSVLEEAKKDPKCFSEFFNQLACGDELVESKLESLNLTDGINQSNIYWKNQRKQPKFLQQHYLLGDTIGRGSYGKVKDALDIRTLKRYAIKIVCRMKIKKIPGGMKHVESEISLMQNLNHKNIVKLIDEFHEVDPERRCIVMEFCLGSIHDLQTNGILESSNQFRCLPEWQAHSYFIQIINGVEYLHNQRLIHKDLKPGNFLLTEHEVLKITDFGVSEKFDIFKENTFITGGQTTPAIQPPELAGGATEVCGYKLDVYGVGVSLYFMLCGRVPFNNTNVLLIFDEIATGEYTISDNVSNLAKDLIQKMMNKDVNKRITLHEVRCQDWYVKNHVPVISTKIDPRQYLSYYVRDPSKLNLYQLSSSYNVIYNDDPVNKRCNSINKFTSSIVPPSIKSVINGEDLNPNKIENFGDPQIESTGLPAIMPLSVISRLRTYYDWPLTVEEEQLLKDQFIVADDFISYQNDDNADDLFPQVMISDHNYQPDIYPCSDNAGSLKSSKQTDQPGVKHYFVNNDKESRNFVGGGVGGGGCGEGGIRFFISDSNESHYPAQTMSNIPSLQFYSVNVDEDGEEIDYDDNVDCGRVDGRDPTTGDYDSSRRSEQTMSVSFSLPSATFNSLVSNTKQVYIDNESGNGFDDDISHKTEPILLVHDPHNYHHHQQHHHYPTPSTSPHHSSIPPPSSSSNSVKHNLTSSSRSFFRSKFKGKKFSNCTPS